MSQVKGLCVMDVDGTLILEEVIDLLGREAGREEEISQITSRAMRGELNFESSLRKRVSFLEGLPVSVFDKAFDSIHLSPNVQEFISILQKNGILVGLVSGVWWFYTNSCEISKITWYYLFLCQPTGSQRWLSNREISWTNYQSSGQKRDSGKMERETKTS